MASPSSFGPTVGVFDSGVGGLSVLKAIRRKRPTVNFIYIADSGNAPYGNRSPDFIEHRASRIAEVLVGSGVQIVVIACNTATAVAVSRLRSQLSVPVVAMEPGIKPAVALTKTGVIGVLATERTLESDAIERLCREFGQGVKILLRPCPGLAELVERGEVSTDHTREYLREIVLPLTAQGADTLVLGCTHYAFLEPLIRDIAGPKVSIVEPSEAVARQVILQLDNEDTPAKSGLAGREMFLTTGVPEHVQSILSRLWGQSVEVRELETTNARAEG
jgi:glutamate racemase